MRIAIVEDEAPCAGMLRNYLERYAQESAQTLDVTCYANGAAFLDDFQKQFDLILLDVAMPGMDGMETARRLRRIDTDVVLLFVTNLGQYAICGYEVEAMDYLIKPVTYFALSQRISRAISRIRSREPNFLIISGRDSARKLDVNSIYFAESQGHSLTLHTAEGNFSFSGTMRELEEKLTPFHFFRCNKGYLVSLRHVDGVQDGCAVIGDAKLLISRARRNEFMEALTNYVGGRVL